MLRIYQANISYGVKVNKMNHFMNNGIEYLRKKRKHPALQDGWDELSREQQVQEMLYWKQKKVK